MCEAGDELAVWFKEERNDVFLFAPGSLAGSGRVAVIEAGDLAKLGIPRQHLRAFENVCISPLIEPLER